MILKIEMDTDCPVSTTLSIDGKKIGGVDSFYVTGDITSNTMAIRIKGRKRELAPDAKMHFAWPIVWVEQWVYGRLIGEDSLRDKKAAELHEAFRENLAKK